jgi:hypothetical protein
MRSVRAALVVALVLPAACNSSTGAPTDLAPPAGDTARDRGAIDQPPVDGPLAPRDSGAQDGPRPDSEKKQLKAGVAAVDITPPTSAGVPLAGFGGDPRRKFTLASIAPHLAAALGNCYDPTPGTVASLFEPSTGKNDPIMARALVIDNGDTRAAIVKLDAIGITRQLRDDIEHEAGKLGVPRQNLIVAATHSHSGPGAVGNHVLFQLIAADCYDTVTYQAMLAGVLSALKQAAAALKPAAIGIDSTTETRVSQNRMGKPSVLDTELGVIKIVDAAGGGPIAAVINFSVHGTCLGASNMLFSADVMGFAERALEKLLGGGVALFLNGAEGDVAPTKGGFAGAATLGDYLAESTHKLWGALATKPWLEIAGSFDDVPMPKATYRGCLPLFGAGQTLCDFIPGLTLPIDAWMQKVLPFAALRLGDVAFATVPGEPTTTLGLEIKAAGKARGFRRTYVVGLANDHMSYATTPEEYDKSDEYEAQSTLYGRNTGTIVVSSATKELDAVKPKSWPDAGIKPLDADGVH